MGAPYLESLEIQQLPLWEQILKERFPLAFTLEVTARCNNNCRHCYINLPAGDVQAASEEMTFSEIMDVADQAVRLGAVWCLITGGEPLLRSDFPEIYLGLRRKGLLVSVYTNATLIREWHMRLFQRYPPRDLEVTVYGVRQETYEAVTRIPGSYAAFRRGVGLLLERRIPVGLKTMAIRSNVHELREIIEFCRRHSTYHGQRFDPLIHLRYDHNPERNAEIISERLSPDEIAMIEESDPDRSSAMRKDCERLLKLERNPLESDYLFRCGAGLREFAVSYNGMFRVCDSLWAPGYLYDLRKGKLRDAWFDVVPRVRDLRSKRTAFLQTCAQCQIINLCHSCPASCYLEGGKMDGVIPYFCEVAHARARMLEVLRQQGSDKKTG